MDIEALKRNSAADIVLLGVFGLGLLVSLIVVTVRGTVELGEPLMVPSGHLAAPLPAGEQWETAGGWRYETDNAFVLLARMRRGNQTIMTVRWRYALCDVEMDAETVLRQRAEAAGGQFVPYSTLHEQVAMVYGRVLSPGHRGEGFLVGIAPLGYGRRLELHISYRMDSGYAENTFAALVGGVVVESPAELAAGADAVGAFFSRAVRNLAQSGLSRETAFLIKDAADRPLGYTVRRLFSHHDDEDGYVRLTSRRLEPTGVYMESDLWVGADEPSLSWMSNLWAPRSESPHTTQLRSNTDGQLLIQTAGNHAQSIQHTPTMLPEPLLSVFAAGLLNTAMPTMRVDVLTGNGQVIPTRIATTDPADSRIRADQPVRIVRATFLHTDGAFDEFVFDADGRLLGRFEQQPRRPGRLWDVVEPEHLREVFGERFEPRSRETVF